MNQRRDSDAVGYSCPTPVFDSVNEAYAWRCECHSALSQTGSSRVRVSLMTGMDYQPGHDMTPPPFSFSSSTGSWPVPPAFLPPSPCWRFPGRHQQSCSWHGSCIRRPRHLPAGPRYRAADRVARRRPCTERRARPGADVHLRQHRCRIAVRPAAGRMPSSGLSCSLCCSFSAPRSSSARHSFFHAS